MTDLPANPSYLLINRLAALRHALATGPQTLHDLLSAGSYPDTASGKRQLQRDVKALRDLGDDIRYTRRDGLYTWVRPAHLALTERAATALGQIRQQCLNDPNAEALLEALEAVAQALEPSARHQFDRPEAALTTLVKPAIDYRPYRETLRLWEKASRQMRRVQFKYQSLEQTAPVTHDKVEPYEVQYLDRHFYLIGYSPRGKGGVWEFRADRVQSLQLEPGKFAAKRRRPAITFTYALDANIANRGLSERFANQRLHAWIDGDAQVQAEGYSAFRIIQDLLRYGEKAELLDPPTLRAKMKAVVEAMARRYQNDT